MQPGKSHLKGFYSSTSSIHKNWLQARCKFCLLCAVARCCKDALPNHSQGMIFETQVTGPCPKYFYPGTVQLMKTGQHFEHVASNMQQPKRGRKLCYLRCEAKQLMHWSADQAAPLRNVFSLGLHTTVGVKYCAQSTRERCSKYHTYPILSHLIPFPGWSNSRGSGGSVSWQNFFKVQLSWVASGSNETRGLWSL